MKYIYAYDTEPDNTMQLNLEEFANNLDSELNKPKTGKSVGTGIGDTGRVKRAVRTIKCGVYPGG